MKLVLSSISVRPQKVVPLKAPHLIKFIRLSLSKPKGTPNSPLLRPERVNVITPNPAPNEKMNRQPFISSEVIVNLFRASG